jgi:hypothetical protein
VGLVAKSKYGVNIAIATNTGSVETEDHWMGQTGKYKEIVDLAARLLPHLFRRVPVPYVSPNSVAKVVAG